MIIVATSRNSNLASEFGGTPWSLIQGFKSLGVESRGVNLAPFWLLRILSFIWRILRVLSLRKPFGWQYSSTSRWARGLILKREILEGDYLLSFYQIVPNLAGPYCIYTDCSLKFIFDNYPESRLVPNDVKVKALVYEKKTYENAQFIFLKTEQAILDLHDNYGIPLTKMKLQIVPPNNVIRLTPEILNERRNSSRRKVRFVFIGKDGQRKGLDKAIELIRNLGKVGISCRLDVVGSLEFRELASDLEDVKFHGVLPLGSKVIAELMRNSHFGLLLSRNEAAGISLMEFQAAGLIPIVSAFPGVESGLLARNYFKLSTAETLSEFGDRIARYINSANFDLGLAEAIEDAARIPSWKSTAMEIQEVTKST